MFFYSLPRSLGRWSNLTHIFQMGWNHQLEVVFGLPSHFASLRCMTMMWRFFDCWLNIKVESNLRFSCQDAACTMCGYITCRWKVDTFLGNGTKHPPWKLACRLKNDGWKGCWKAIFLFHQVASFPRIPPSDSPDGWQEVRNLPNLPPEAWKTEMAFVERVFCWGRQGGVVKVIDSRLILWYNHSGCVCLQWFLVVAGMNMLIYT